jgi:TPR repeat protein
MRNVYWQGLVLKCIEYLRCAADHGLLSGQLRCGTLFPQDLHIERKLSFSVHYFKSPADQGSNESEIELALFLIQGDDIPRDVRESEDYL